MMLSLRLVCLAYLLILFIHTYIIPLFATICIMRYCLRKSDDLWSSAKAVSCVGDYFKSRGSQLSGYADKLDSYISKNTKIRFSKNSAKKCSFSIAFFARV